MAIEWLLVERYNALELSAAIMLALLPGAAISQIGVLLIEKRLGVDLRRRN